MRASAHAALAAAMVASIVAGSSHVRAGSLGGNSSLVKYPRLPSGKGETTTGSSGGAPVLAALAITPRHNLHVNPPSAAGRKIDHHFAAIEAIQNPENCRTVEKVHRLRAFQLTGFGTMVHQLAGLEIELFDGRNDSIAA